MIGTILNIARSSYDRFFIVGEFYDSYYSFIDLLYQQDFSYKDCLIFTGNFLNFELNTTHLLNLISLVKNNANCYAVLGQCEQNFISLYDNNSLPHSLSVLVNVDMIATIRSLPSYIFIDRDFIVAAELEEGLPYAKYFNNFAYSRPYMTDVSIDTQFNLGCNKKSDLRCLIYSSTLQESILVEVPLEGAYYV